MPAMQAHVDPVIRQCNTFLAQALTLFLACRASGAQSRAPASSDDPMPGQGRTFWQLRQRASGPARGTLCTGQFSQLPVADH